MLAGKSLGSGILAAVGGGGSRKPPEIPTGCSEGSRNTGVKQLSPEISWGQAGSTGKRGTVGDLRNCGRVVPGLRDLDGHSRSSAIGGREGSLRLKVGVDLPFPFARRWPSSARGPQRPGAAGAAGRAPPGCPSCGGRGGAAISVLDSADIEVTDSRLPNATFMAHRPQHRRSETLGTRTAPPQVTQGKTRGASKPLQASGRFCVELVRSSVGFGLTLSGGRDRGGDAPLAVRGLLKDGPAQRCGRLQPGDLVLHINGESTQGLTHAQVVERIRASGPRLCLVLSRPPKTHPDLSPDPGRPEVMRSRSASASPLQHPRPRTTPQTRGSAELSPAGAADDPADPPLERCTEDPEDQTPDSPGPWLVPSEERLSRALGVPGAAQFALEMAAGRRRH
ncbi:PDZ domain-containing protein MAGIX isoform X2 [Phacochoerus africanus]|uniref:PDZ domain-containing protein MAGIX isoform X2 n=1 Tax=Phacochoerus africanus TaxID=41426 RepID=UPI001FD9DBA4|nr:PDZ domain-containing protein MAGIX isoform X2 [Phacochoerus africanus]